MNPSDATQFRATFTPQAWIRDQAIEVDAEGETSWDVSAYVATLQPGFRERAILTNTDESDQLREDPNAPEWIRNWRGPSYTTVEYFDPAEDEWIETERL